MVLHSDSSCRLNPISTCCEAGIRLLSEQYQVISDDNYVGTIQLCRTTDIDLPVWGLNINPDMVITQGFMANVWECLAHELTKVLENKVAV